MNINSITTNEWYKYNSSSVSTNDSPLLSQNQSTLQETSEADALEIKNAKLQNVASTTNDPNMRLFFTWNKIK